LPGHGLKKGVTVAVKVLIIEDTATFRMLLSTTLRKSNFEVVAAENGAAGIQRASKETPQIITLDLSLPDMSGAEVIISLKADPATRQIPVVVCTASVDADVRNEVMRQGAVEILTKPVLPADLISTLNRHLSQFSEDTSKQ
jgi:CheY-like chemotaxis protein